MLLFPSFKCRSNGVRLSSLLVVVVSIVGEVARMNSFLAPRARRSRTRLETSLSLEDDADALPLVLAATLVDAGVFGGFFFVEDDGFS